MMTSTGAVLMIWLYALRIAFSYSSELAIDPSHPKDFKDTLSAQMRMGSALEFGLC